MTNIIHKIDSKDISVIIQGAITKETDACLRSIRECLPLAEIILSTWEKSNTTNLDYDVLLLNEDPGFFYVSENKLNNVNRQIVSTLNGIKVSKNKYVLKLRTDFLLEKFDVDYETLTDNKSSSSLLKCTNEKILIFSYLDFPYFFPCDWTFFGNKQDMLNLFSIPLLNNADAYYFHNNIPFNNKYYKENKYLCRFLPENYICYHFFSKYYNLDIPDFTYKSFVCKIISRCFLLSNFCILDKKNFCVKPLKSDLLPAYNCLKNGAGSWINAQSYIYIYIEECQIYFSDLLQKL